LLDGTILAPNASIAMSSGLVDSEIISWKSIQLSAFGQVTGYVYGTPGTVIGAGLSVFVFLDGSFLIVAGAPKGFPLVAAIRQCLIDQIAGIDGVTIDHEKGAFFRFFGNREPAWARSRPLITTCATPAGSSPVKAGFSFTISDVPARQRMLKMSTAFLPRKTACRSLIIFQTWSQRGP
jgi:hypothetical protein